MNTKNNDNSKLSVVHNISLCGKIITGVLLVGGLAYLSKTAYNKYCKKDDDNTNCICDN